MSALGIFVHGVRVGLLERMEDWVHRFSFDAAWLEMPGRPILGQIFEDRRPHDILTSGLPCWFAHLLPQGPLRRALERQLADEDADDFDLLRLLGEDLPGAVVALPAEPSLRPLAWKPTLPGHSGTDAEGALFFALAGVQWKLSVRDGERGLVVPARGDTGHFIAKFYDPTFPGLPRVEYSTMEWARLSGVSVPHFRLATTAEFPRLPEGIPLGNGDVFLIERFDRAGDGSRVHMEDFGQVLDRPPGDAQYSGSYEHIGAVLAALAPEDARGFCERVAFCAVAGNGDAHLKNWTLLYPDGHSARLSPAYDLVATVVYPRVEDRLALSLASSRSFEDVSERSFEPLARVFGVDFAAVSGWARGIAERTREAYHAHAMDWPLSDAEREQLTRHMARVPLGR